jgi:photosystem II stability/assembly factor-like uncharacterized protein
VGKLWTESPERGVFKSNDGGKTWQHVLKLDSLTGVIDLSLNPAEPDRVYAAAYPVRRNPFSVGAPEIQWGPKGGIYRTEDAGKTWTKCANGLPQRDIGRCGLAIFRNDPKIVYAVVQTDLTDGPTDNRGQVQKPNTGNLEKGGIFRSDDHGKSWKKLNNLCPRPFYYGQIRVDPTDDQRIYVLGIAFHVSNDGGKTFATPTTGTHSDHHALWVNPKNSAQVYLGNDGGFYTSNDRAKTWTPHRAMAIGQFYNIAVDTREPYRIMGGLQDNGTYSGPSRTNSTAGITLADWKRMNGGDGFGAAYDPTRPDVAYASSQYGSVRRILLNPDGSVKPTIPPKKNDDDDDDHCQPEPERVTARLIKPIAPKDQPAYRFHWNTPFLLSHFDAKILYLGANRVLRSRDRGTTWTAISPDLTHGKPETTGSKHTLTALAESPLRAGVLAAGSEDGRLHLTSDEGKTWKELSLPDAPKGYLVSRIEFSHHDTSTLLVTIDGHRVNDLKPRVYRSADLGKTWKSIAGNLPAGTVAQVIRESSVNPNLLFVGLEHGLYASFDQGKSWHRYPGLPAVPVHDLVIHPRERELVVATHGRSLGIIDIAPLEQLKAQPESALLFPPRHVRLAPREKPAEEPPVTQFRGRNPDPGAKIEFWLPQRSAAEVMILSPAGEIVQKKSWTTVSGYQTWKWDPLAEKGIKPGKYLVELVVGKTRLRQPLLLTAPQEAN